eukprot:4088520-Pleurochrysis_carterae.AAC.1
MVYWPVRCRRSTSSSTPHPQQYSVGPEALAAANAATHIAAGQWSLLDSGGFGRKLPLHKYALGLALLLHEV